MIKGQDEIGEENGTLHIQFAVNTAQVRMSSLCEWLPRAHFEAARNANAVANYCKKTKTSVEGTQFEHNYISANGTLTMANVMMKIAEVANISKTKQRLTANDGEPLEKPNVVYSDEFWAAVEILLGEDENLVALLTQPQYERAWVKTRRVWLTKLAIDRQTSVSVANIPDDEGTENILVPLV